MTRVAIANSAQSTMSSSMAASNSHPRLMGAFHPSERRTFLEVTEEHDVRARYHKTSGGVTAIVATPGIRCEAEPPRLNRQGTSGGTGRLDTSRRLRACFKKSTQQP